MHTEFIFLSIALLLIALGTFLSPLLGYLVYRISNSGRKAQATQLTGPFSLDVLLPAHNEPESLPATIAALKSMRVASADIFSEMNIIVGLSNWSGEVAAHASRGADRVVEIPKAGKWNAILELVRNSTAEWVALVDSGVIWEPSLLKILAPHFRDQNCMALNPQFREHKRGKLQKMIWTLESRLKKIENLAGGPVSLHGATIFFRRNNLLAALADLEGTEWLNDDVVLPLTLRRLFPEMKIVYSLETSVTDEFPSWNMSEMKRRKRLLYGNIQWVKHTYFKLWYTKPAIAFIATRRVSRMVWAWWFVFLGLCFLFSAQRNFGNAGFIACVSLGAIAFMILLKSQSGKRLLEAFWISFVFPVYFLSFCITGVLPSWK